jgi:hypothetical protein
MLFRGRVAGVRFNLLSFAGFGTRVPIAKIQRPCPGAEGRDLMAWKIS